MERREYSRDISTWLIFHILVCVVFNGGTCASYVHQASSQIHFCVVKAENHNDFLYGPRIPAIPASFSTNVPF